MKRMSSRFTRRHGMRAAISAFSAGYLGATQVPDFTRNIPPADAQSLTGSQFAESVLTMNRHQREQAILDHLVAGNLPTFLRKLVPVKLDAELGGKTLSVTIFVMPEYLAIGSDNDFLRIPMNLHTATAVADRFGFVLPTRKIVDAIYDKASCHFTPQPLPAGPQMTSTAARRSPGSRSRRRRARGRRRTRARRRSAPGRSGSEPR